MSNGSDWSNLTTKRAAILRVLRHLVANPTVAQNCIGNDPAFKNLFQDQNVGNITLPQGARVILFSSGEEALNVGSSVMIENPSTASASATDRELLSYVLGNYKYW